MENFQYSVHLSEQDWAEFLATAEECDLLQASLASGDELLSSDIDQGDSSGSSPPGPPPHLKGQSTPAGRGWPGFEEEDKAVTRQLVSSAWREPGLALGASQQTPSTSTQSEVWLPLSSGQNSSFLGSSRSEMQRLLQGPAPRGPALSPPEGTSQSSEAPACSAAPQGHPSSPGAPTRSPSRKKRRSAGAKAGSRSSTPGSAPTQASSPLGANTRGPGPGEGPLAMVGMRTPGTRQEKSWQDSTEAPEQMATQSLDLSTPASPTKQGQDRLRMTSGAQPHAKSSPAQEGRLDSSVAKLDTPLSTPASKTQPDTPLLTPTSKLHLNTPPSTPASKTQPDTPLSTPASKTQPDTPLPTSTSKLHLNTPSSAPASKTQPDKYPLSTPASKTQPDTPLPTPASKLHLNTPPSTPASKTQLDTPLSTPASRTQPNTPLSTPASKTQPDTPPSTPASKPQPDTPLSTPVSKPHLNIPLSTPVSETQPNTPLSTPASKTHPDTPPPTPASQSQPDTSLSTPASKTQPDTPLSTPVSKPQTDTPSSTPASKPQPDTPLSTPSSKIQPDTPPSTPTSKLQLDTSLSTPSSKIEFDTPLSTLASVPQPNMPLSIPASEIQPNMPLSTPSSKIQPDTSLSTFVSKPQLNTPLAIPTSKPRLDTDLGITSPVVEKEVDSSVLASKAAPPTAPSAAGLPPPAPTPQSGPSALGMESAPVSELGLSPAVASGWPQESPSGESPEGAPAGPAPVPRRKKVRFSVPPSCPEEPGSGGASAPPSPATAWPSALRTVAGGCGGPGAWDAVAVGPRPPQPRILKHLPPPAPSALAGSGPRSSFVVTLPEAYEFFFCDTIEEEEEEDEEASEIPTEVQWPDVCEFFFRDRRAQRAGLRGGTQASAPRKEPVPGFPAPMKDPAPITTPETYEHFVGENQSRSTLEPVVLQLQATGKESLPEAPSRKVGPGCSQEPQCAATKQLQLALKQTGEPWGPLTSFNFSQKDMCLVFVAFASWAVRTSDLHNPDAWKTVLLANIGSVSAIRYFRRHVGRRHRSPSRSRSPSPSS